MNNTAPSPWWRKDASIVAALVALAVVTFTITLFYTKSYARRRESLARHSFQSGMASLATNHAADAVKDLRTALAYAPDNLDYRLRLAQALASSGETDQAVAYFLNLWEGQPGNGLYNLELARLYARENNNRLAAQRYSAAINGAWDDNPAEQRRLARLEYIRFLLGNNSYTQAQAEAITLAAAVPPNDIANRFVAAQTLLLTGEYERALQSFLSLTNADPGRAMGGAGQAAFKLGRFRSAIKYLQAAASKGAAPPTANDQLDLAKLVLSMDPTQHRLRPEERARRVWSAYQTSGQRLRLCASKLNQPLEVAPPVTDLQKLYDEWAALGPAPSLKLLAEDPDQRDQVMDLVGRIEETSNRLCGAPSGMDWALLMLGRFGEGVER